MHGFYAGVDAMGQFVRELEASDVPLTNGRGAFSASLAEYAITAALHFTKQVPRCMRNREDKVWDKFEMSMLRGKTLGLVGYGDIAKASRSNPSPNPNANANPNPNPSPNPNPNPNPKPNQGAAPPPRRALRPRAGRDQRGRAHPPPHARGAQTVRRPRRRPAGTRSWAAIRVRVGLGLGLEP